MIQISAPSCLLRFSARLNEKFVRLNDAAQKGSDTLGGPHRCFSPEQKSKIDAMINLDTLETFEGELVSPETLRAKGLVHKHGLVKVLGRGELTRKLTVSAHAFSAAAVAAIEGAGGRIETIPLPWGDRRPPAKGNALTNR